MRLAQRVVRSALALALLMPLVALALVPSAGPATSAARLATISVTTLDPIVAGPGDTVHAGGSVRNTSQEVLRGLEIRLRLSRTPVGSRAELAAVAAGQSTTRDGDVVATLTPDPRDLAEGRQVRFDFSMDLDKADTLDQFGVYVISIEVLASHRDGFGRVAITRTFLPWVPARPGISPTGFSWLWPVVAAPERLANGAFVDDNLAATMAPGGRLDRLVTAGARLSETTPPTWAVDPDLVETATDMSNGYGVQAPDGSRVEGGGSGLAALWLDELRAATQSGTVLALPYADTDLVALRRAGMTRDMTTSLTLGGQTAATLLHRPVTSDVIWPADGAANRQTLSVLRGEGLRATFLDGATVPPRLELNYTPSGRANVGTPRGRVAALLYDPDLTALLGSRRGSPLLAAQRFVAETAMIAAEQPNSGTERVIVVAPPRRWSPDAVLLDRVVDGARESAWMAPVSLEQLIATRPPEIDREPLRYPDKAREAELPEPYLAAIRFYQADTAVFGAVLTRPRRIVPSFERAALRLESTWWRGRESRVNRLATERGYLADKRRQIRILPGTFTLGSNRGSIPITIVNELRQRVVVGVRLVPQTRRLRVQQPGLIAVEPRSKRQVEVPVTAVAKGLVPVDAQLHTPGGLPYSQPVQLRVRATQYGTVALIITVGAAGVLFLAAGVRVARRAITSRRTGEGPADHD